MRLEEREVFPLIERVMPEHELDAAAHALEVAPRHVHAVSGYRRSCRRPHGAGFAGLVHFYTVRL